MTSEELLPKVVKKNESAEPRKCCMWFCQITSEAFLEEEDLLHYIGRVESSLSKSVIGGLTLLLGYTLSILSLTFGILLSGTCPCQPVLPTFLIVHGSAMIIRCLFDTVKLCGQATTEQNDSGCSPFQTLSKICGVLLTFWTITGSIWVYSTLYKVETKDTMNMNFCDPMLYWYSLVLVSVFLLGLVWKLIFLLTISVVYCKYENQSWYSQIMEDSLGEFV